MKGMRILVAAILALGAIGYGLFHYAFPSVTVRYRLTLEAEVDGRPAVGSGVIEVTRSGYSAHLADSARRSGVKQSSSIWVAMARYLPFYTGPILVSRKTRPFRPTFSSTHSIITSTQK